MHFQQRLISVVISSLSLLLIQCQPQTELFTRLSENKTGLDFSNQIIESEHNNIMTYEYSYNGGGVATGDINNDGLADVYLSGNTVPNKLFLNKGNWKFEDITTTSHLIEKQGWKTGVTMADVNGDGWLDVYICYSGNTEREGKGKPVIRDHPMRANQLFINQGCEKGGIPVFKEQAKEFGLDAVGTFSTQSYFFDMDRDGDLDMFLLNHANTFYSSLFNVKKLRGLRHPYFGNRLYRNDNNIFTNVSDSALIHGSGLNFGLSVSISDLNQDNWPDIYVTNDYDEQDFCYINNGNGTFREVSHTIFAHLSKNGMGSDIADINNDALPEIFVADMLPEDNHRQKLLKGPDEYDKYSLAVDSGYHHQYMRNTLQLNRGFAPDTLPRFSEVGQLAGVSNTDWSWAPLFADFDNDGFKDLFITNGYLRDYTNQDFIRYTVADAVAQARASGRDIPVLKLIQEMPSTKLTNYCFRNTDGLHFENVTRQWGFTHSSVSNAASYCDLDNDGDLDLIVNTLNDKVSVFQNQQEKFAKNNFIKIRLIGKKPNTFGIGAKVWITLQDKTIYQEAYFSRGYQSSVEPLLTVGIGQSAVKEIRVQWPDEKVTIVSAPSINQLIEIEQEKAQPNSKIDDLLTHRIKEPLLSPVKDGIDFKHSENGFVDFKMQQLLSYQLSRLGGKLAVGDVNKDGNEDVFLGGAAGQSGQLYLGTDNGTLVKSASEPWQTDRVAEDIGSVFFDADGDKDLDLYIVSGGNEFSPSDLLYQDRLYLNDGKGNFAKSPDALPSEQTSGSCVVAIDYDKDGDQDLFVGGRIAAQQYPKVPKSFLLRNDSQPGKVRFTDVTALASDQLSNAGMVTGAIWTDLNADTWPDLVVVGEWMGIRMYINQKGKLKESTSSFGLPDSRGWWSAIAQADVDQDGDMDLLLGNAGINMQLRASEKQPLRCYGVDIDQDGRLDPLVSFYVQDKSYPLATRDELLGQVTPMRKRFINYGAYADATVEDILSPELRAKTQLLEAVELRSCWLENKGNSKFALKPLPDWAQFSSINGFLSSDFDGDGKVEVLAAGNFFPYKVQLGRSDALMGVLLRFEKGEVQPILDKPLWLTGDIRDMAFIKFKNTSSRVVVSRNNDYATLYDYKSANVSTKIVHSK
ncbi:VCBS repeat-containing protein [Xanthocytophaga flava]|uniref:VCBS repeat-containing protein n=1 Tax=Xanthocytophaga flava TaxID=3048013 RepID=UPI0028D4D97D|nr:VCBS repeat-containing protein [Xanthocytophaga flavus]MDJ1466865.1 VCBS repeat-containing protein [Xanthocytophaga flavus]